MERLTKKYKDGSYTFNAPLVEITDRLAAYEDTGLTPEAVQQQGMDLDVTRDNLFLAREELNAVETELECFKKAETDGWLVVLPCKVGNTVYVLPRSWEDKEICDWEITNLTITQNKKLEWTKKYRAMKLFNGKTIDCGIDFRFDEIGKTVFLTREEAEAALEKGTHENL